MKIAEKTSQLFAEFKAFAFKGNVVDMAVGVVIGGAFGVIISSLVSNIVMPLISLVTPGGHHYADWKWTIHRGTEMVNGVATPKVVEIPYGIFLNDIVSFLVIALVLFLVIKKFLGFVMRSKEEAAAAPPPVQETLLTEIRDILKNSKTP
ncbi:MAG: large conductance mechanosensitive channel protein MscL [Fibrobacter sp.]|nr:large conductance mechanosensitive channel protein MscL [Fibrobacter sp.]